MRTALYYKRINSHFSFSHHPSHKVLWMTGHTERSGLSRRNEMKTETMLHRQAFMKHGCAV